MVEKFRKKVGSAQITDPLLRSQNRHAYTGLVELKNSFARTAGVSRLQYVSQDEAWQFLASNLLGSAELLDGLDADVLPASFELTLDRGLTGPGLDSQLESWAAMPEIDDVQYNHQLGRRMQGAMGLVRWVAWALGALALVASTIIVGATFQLAVFTLLYIRNAVCPLGRVVGGGAGPATTASVTHT